jgi:hypothetical protein
MSNLTNTYTETIGAVPVAGSALSDSASTGVVISTAAQAYEIPAGFFSNPISLNKAIQVTGFGIYSTAASGNATLQFQIYADTVIGTKSITLGSNTAATGTTLPVSAANAIWVINAWITCQSFSAGAAQLVTFGDITMGNGAAAGVSYTFGSATPVSLTSSWNTNYFLELGATWGTAVVGDALTCEQWIVQGMN